MGACCGAWRRGEAWLGFWGMFGGERTWAACGGAGGVVLPRGMASIIEAMGQQDHAPWQHHAGVVCNRHPPTALPDFSALLTYVWGKMTTEAGSVKGVLMAVGVAKLEEETHG